MTDIHLLGTALAILSIANFFAVRAIMKIINRISDRVYDLENQPSEAWPIKSRVVRR